MKLKGIIAISLLLVVIFTSCGSSEGLFSKRKYRKGVYYDLAESKGKTKINESKKVESKEETENKIEPNVVESTPELYASSDNSISLPKENKVLIAPTKRESIASKIITKKEDAIKKLKEYKASDDEKKGNKHKNWAAILGFILAFLFPLAGVILCLIGLKSQYKKLAFVGLIICIVYFALVAALFLSA